MSLIVAAVALQGTLAAFAASAGSGPVAMAIGTMLQVTLLLFYRNPHPIFAALISYWLAHAALSWMEPSTGWMILIAVPVGVTAQAVACAAAASSFQLQTSRATTDANELARRGEELSEAQFEAGKANRAKNDFLANLSHEMRTRVNGVMGMTHLLLDTRLTAEQREFATTLERSSKALLEVINEVLDFSNIEAGKMHVGRESFLLASPYEDVLELVGLIAEGKGLEILCELDSRIPVEVIGDARRLRQVLLNLVGNGLKFTDSGHVLIQTTLEEETPAELVIRTEVTDTGVGIGGEAHETLFQPFTQGSGQLVRQYGGTGLGLAIAKRLVAMMGGEIGIGSASGKGARFWFTIRCGRVRKERFVDVGDLAGKRVLVLCRYPQAATVIASQLRQWGLEAFAASHEETAIAELLYGQRQQLPYDAVLMEGEDRGMKSSQSWLERIAAVGPIPAIAIIGFGKWHALDDDSAGGFDAFVTKPLRASGVLAALRTALYGTADSAESFKPAPVANSCSVLLVEDNRVNQRVAVGMLTKLGYRVDVAADGVRALEALERRSYHLILMDCMMPEMDGFEATAAIRQREQAGQHTTIIAMTACATAGDEERCMAAGMDDFITKPVEIHRLKHVMDRWTTARNSQSVP